MGKNKLCDNYHDISFTKANMLIFLKKKLKKSKIEDIFVVHYKEFQTNGDLLVRNIEKFFHGKTIIVRSSSKQEDIYNKSNAGHFTSINNIDSSKYRIVKKAISDVFQSYGKVIDENEQVLIQRQTKNVLLSGVVLTNDIQKNSPYYVINYDTSGSTNSVTSGAINNSVWLFNPINLKHVPVKWQKLMTSIWEIETILEDRLLDIEFAITQEAIVIFQVRHLSSIDSRNDNYDIQLIKRIKDSLKRKYHYYQHQNLTFFSDMAFWNPAEIIGDNPKDLDYSLYSEIITKSAWNIGLIPLGYRNTDKALMFRFGNKPYINLELAFEALLPASLSEKIVNKLLKFYIAKIKVEPSSHDKIEFEISYNCYDFTTDKRLEELAKCGFTNDEILELKEELKDLTTKILINYNEILNGDLKSLKKLEETRINICDSVKDTLSLKTLTKAIHTLLVAIEKYGTQPFSRHARCAFIAKSLCQSLLMEKYITTDEYNQFMSSIHTIASEYNYDYQAVMNGTMKKNVFKEKYGHLRAETYNIRNLRYDQNENLFANFNKITLNHHLKYNQENITPKMLEAIDKALEKAQISELNSHDVLIFIKTEIAQREYFKFIFTKSLSYVIELIKKIGLILNIAIDDLSYLQISDIYKLEKCSNIEQTKKAIDNVIYQRKNKYQNNSKLILPEIITAVQDFDYITNINARPNFITNEIITADIVIINNKTDMESIKGKIAVIEKADPGFDWIFSKSIAGLVTKYGGVASHMAIRCSEFKIPAAIGCGNTIFKQILTASKITIDCKHKKIYNDL